MPTNNQNIEAIKYALTDAQRYVYRSIERAEKNGRPAPDMPFERGRIDAFRAALAYLGYDEAEINEIQWGFEV